MGTIPQYTSTMFRQAVALLALCSLAVASESNFCEDGWDLYTVQWGSHTHHSCFWFGNKREQMSYANAEALCNSKGAFLAEVPYGPSLNSWIRHKLLDKTRMNEEAGLDRPHYETQYWLGAKDFGHHCLTFLLYEDFLGFKTFHWNDWDCDQPADFI